VGPVTPTAEAVAIAATLNPEACVLCHNNVSYRGGAGHQADYDQLYQTEVIKVTSMTLTTNGVDTTTLAFKLTKSAANFSCLDADSIGSYWSAFDTTTGRFQNPVTTSSSYLSLKPSLTTTPPQGTITYDGGTNTCTYVKTFTSAADMAAVVQIQAGLDSIVQIYGVDEILETNSDKHMNKGKYPFAGLLRLGTTMGAATAPYVTAANVTGCENCHTQPFLKHAYIKGTVDDLTPLAAANTTQQFYVCKGCHSDARNGGHQLWQILREAKDADPATADGQFLRTLAVALDAGTALDATQQAYVNERAYKARLMNDVHMSHAMEFAYPQSMRNCVTCHAGKLDNTTGIFKNDNFRGETCISCHAPKGIMAKMTAASYNHAGIADTVALLKATNCANCHDGSIPAAPTFTQIHTGGYDPKIYASDGTRYSTNITVSINSASLANNVLTVNFTASGSVGSIAATSIVPTVIVGLYGYDTKDFIVAAHGRDSDGKRLLEYKLGDTNPRFTGTVNSPGNWTVTADISAWASMVTDGSVRRAEIAVLPEVKNASGLVLGLDAVSRTFDLGANAFDDAFYVNPVVEHKTNRTLAASGYVGVKGCNTCHDQLATTFHSGIRGGNIRVCRLCHVKSSGGSHLEIQSRSIDSYVHAIHSFQAFDVGDINFADAFEAMEYRHHTETYFPRFGLGDGATDCESCHVPGKYEPSDQTKSLPALWSATDTITGTTRSIPAKAAVVSGPAATACGGCHRAHKIVEDDGGGLNVLYGHWSQFGYLKENVDTLWDAVIQKFF